MAIEPTENVGTKLIFENEKVRVWDLALQPGESLEKHIHRLPYFFMVIEGGSLRFVDPENPENDRDLQFEPDLLRFHEAEEGGVVHNRLVNVGDKPYRNLVVELKED